MTVTNMDEKTTLKNKHTTYDKNRPNTSRLDIPPPLHFSTKPIQTQTDLVYKLKWTLTIQTYPHTGRLELVSLHVRNCQLSRQNKTTLGS